MKRDKRKITISHEDKTVFLNHAGNRVALQSGMNDRILFFHYDADRTLVLTKNSSLGYIGAELINLKTMATEHEIFIQNASEQLSELNKNIFEYSDNAIADILNQYLY